MLFLDANYFLRFLTDSDLPKTIEMTNTANQLFAAIEAGDVQVTTNEVVIHEVAYTLTSKNSYGVSPEVVAERLAVILRLAGFRFPAGTKQRCLRALEVWSSFPTIGFADALMVATVENSEIKLATFDSHFRSIPNIALWDPETLSTS